jgi:alkyl hydroperoxide reductase subunit AhpC
MEVLKLGQKVPDFELNTYDPAEAKFKVFRLADQIERKRWTILFFYPADFTFVCATEFAALAERHENFQKLDCDVVTVSTDTQFVHLAWRQSEGELANVRYPMAADRTGKVSQLFGVYDENTGLALRGTFIIDPKGVLVNSEVNFYNLGRNIDELMRKFKANLYMSTNPAEVCPAKHASRHEGEPFGLPRSCPSVVLAGRV